MIVALMIGRAGSQGLPDKNLTKIFGKRLCEYPIIAAKGTKKIEQIFVSTDCPKIKKFTKKYKVTFLKRPKYLATSKALGEDVFKDAYFKINSIVEKIEEALKSNIIFAKNKNKLSN